MNLKTLMMAAVFGLTLTPVLTVAETGMDAKESAGPVQGRGVITAINTENRKVTLNHEPIPELNWPRMTMGFPVAPEVNLDGLSKDDTVAFTLTPAGKGQQVTAISKQ
ncbi:copper-binding protein [Marinobacter sp. TBZ242]|uniref:Copper-binding protein n=1 Tax=Marinobacter azerbaijanicus TaxID=3050455 RepID=A0ABT7IGI3_9GAMM|nr:copper-binding protein [Marinobacter sp. TBZ242]MDL0432778.1 copper-binding protein [Marinobacter sp. TBZ242]